MRPGGIRTDNMANRKKSLDRTKNTSNLFRGNKSDTKTSRIRGITSRPNPRSSEKSERKLQGSTLQSKNRSVFMRKKYSKYLKILSKESKELEEKKVFIAKFLLSEVDPIAIAFLAASDTKACILILFARAVPLVIISLVVAIIISVRNYPGEEYLNSASDFEIALGALTIGLFAFVSLIGPLTRPFLIMDEINELRASINDSSAAARQGVSLGAISLFFKSFSTLIVVVVSVITAVLNARAIINMLWTTLALTWLTNLDIILLKEMVHRFYLNSTVVVAVSRLKWTDKDTEKEFWRMSWTSKSDIRKGLRDLDVDSSIKWILLTNRERGLGLGVNETQGVPVSCAMEIKLLKWTNIDEEGIEDLGKISANAINNREWIYSMSPMQRRWFFKYYPFKASEMAWAGSVILKNNFQAVHVTALVRMIENPANDIEKLFLNSNSINDEVVQVIADTLMKNHTITELWLCENTIGDEGAKALAQMLEFNTSLRTLQLRSNNIGDPGANEFARVIGKNCCLRILGLDNNNISEAGIIMLLNSVKTAVNLRRLWIHGNNFDEEKFETENEELLTPRASLDSSVIPPECIGSLDEGKKKIDDREIKSQSCCPRASLNSIDVAKRASANSIDGPSDQKAP